jgi:hypothetical protein
LERVGQAGFNDKGSRKLSEHDEQKALFDWAELDGRPGLSMMFAIPNGGHRKKQVAAKLKAEGVKRGVPDICLPVARNGYNGLYIELKKPKDTTPAGKPTKEQIEWLGALSDEGYFAVMCIGWEAAKATICDYLDG